MKKILFILFIIPLISYSQNNDFLTNLFLDSVQIKNQDFKLKLSAVINTKAQVIVSGSNDYYSKRNTKYLSEVLFLDDLLVAQQFKSSVTIGSLDGWASKEQRKTLIDKCSWNWSNKNPNMKMVSPHSLDYFPTLSFLKGKLLTIVDIDSVSKDYLFSVSRSEKHDNYGHKTLKFNLTDDSEKGYTINTIIVNDECYIIFDKGDMSDLGFDTKFVDGSMFKIFCGNNKTEKSYALNSDGYYGDDYFRDCICDCESNYLSFFRKKTKYMNDTYNLNQDDLLYLFKLEKKDF
tara:strand:- start:1486 stop:2355 length:870 start_codon:yes stop_codon:yes gene_type:complete